MSKNQNIQLLNGKNFQTWYYKITLEIQKLGLEQHLVNDVVDQVEKEVPADPNKINNTKKDCATVLSTVANSIDDAILIKYINIKKPNELIKKLKKKYLGEDYDIKQWLSQLNSLKATKKQDVIQVLDDMWDIFEQMSNGEFKLSNKEKVKYMYNALPKEYQNVVQVTVDTTPLNYYNELNKIFSMKSFLEDWKLPDDQIYDPMDIDYVGKIKNNNNYQIKKYNCDICKMDNHKTDNCCYNIKNVNSPYHKFYKNKEKQNNNSKKNNKNNKKQKKNNNNSNKSEIGLIESKIINEDENDAINYEEIKTLFQNSIDFIGIIPQNTNYNNKQDKNNDIMSIHNIEWLIDTGACEHLTNNKDLLTNYVDKPKEFVCANGTLCKFEGYGDYQFKLNDTIITIHNVYYSSKVTRNIISQITLNIQGYPTLSEKANTSNNLAKLTIYDEKFNVIGIYYSTNSKQFLINTIPIKTNDTNDCLQQVNEISDDSKIIWHRRLGHFYQVDLEKYLKIHDINIPLCNDCKITKMKRLPHNGDTPDTNDILEYLHSDIIGPISKSITGKRFILTMIDGASRKAWIFLLKSKSEAPDIIIEFITFLNNNNNNKKVINFMSDNGKEYNNKKVIDFCKKEGINKIYSPPYNPENNGLAERFNQTLISCAKTLIFWSKLSDNFWDYAVNYACLLYNITPHSGINNNIPDEVFYSKKVILKHIKVFGCVCYYKDFNQNKGKFEPNSNKGIFLGFDLKSYSNIVMDYNDHKIHRVREIECLENEPANISLSNSVDIGTNNFLKYSFIKPDEYFQNYSNENNSSSNHNIIKDDETSKTKNNQNKTIIDEIPNTNNNEASGSALDPIPKPTTDENTSNENSIKNTNSTNNLSKNNNIVDTEENNTNGLNESQDASNQNIPSPPNNDTENSVNTNNSKKKGTYKSILLERRNKRKNKGKNSLSTDSTPNNLTRDNIIKTRQKENINNKNKNLSDVPTTSDNKNNTIYIEKSTNNPNEINTDSKDEKISNFLNEKSEKNFINKNFNKNDSKILNKNLIKSNESNIDKNNFSENSKNLSSDKILPNLENSSEIINNENNNNLSSEIINNENNNNLSSENFKDNTNSLINKKSTNNIINENINNDINNISNKVLYQNKKETNISKRGSNENNNKVIQGKITIIEKHKGSNFNNKTTITGKFNKESEFIKFLNNNFVKEENKQNNNIYENNNINNKQNKNNVTNKNMNENNNNIIFNKKENNSNGNENFIATVSTDVPLSYTEAINSDNSIQWDGAMKDELGNLKRNNTFKFVKKVPVGKTVISTKWVFTIKRDSNNNISKYKARIVARGFRQKRGIDFELTFSPTLNIDILKLILSIASKFSWNIQQLDIKAAYLNAELDKEIYATIPPGDSNFGRGYWLLKKALYGLRQSGRQWNKTITKFLKSNGFKQVGTEKCVFYKRSKNKLKCIIGLYVDDMIITGTKSEIENITNKIKNKFKISKCGPIDYILGIKVENKNNKYSISQTGFIENLLKRFNIQTSRKVKTPCSGDDPKNENKTLFDKTKYKSAIGSLIYLSRCTRPDIAFAVQKASRRSENPNVSDWNKVVKIMKYLKHHKDYKITYDGEGEINAFADADFAGDLDDRKSTSGYIILMGKNPICWCSRKQKSVATSTAEAEYVSTAQCIKMLLRIKNILKEIFNYNKSFKLYTDNKASKTSFENGELNSKLKHISVNYYFDLDNINKKVITLEYIETKSMLADALTKSLNGNQITHFANQVFDLK